MATRVKPILVLYATREGHSLCMASHIASRARNAGFNVHVYDVAKVPAQIDVDSYQAVILAASVHFGVHALAMVDFVHGHRAELQRVPTAFLSVSLAQAAAEDSSRTAEQRSRGRDAANEAMQKFCERTDFHPFKIAAIAGALPYTRYNFILRFVMRQIAKRSGASLDTSRDHDYTNWIALDAIVDAHMRAAIESSHGTSHFVRLVAPEVSAA